MLKKTKEEKMLFPPKNDDLQATIDALNASQAVIEFKPTGEIAVSYTHLDVYKRQI